MRVLAGCIVPAVLLLFIGSKLTHCSPPLPSNPPTPSLLLQPSGNNVNNMKGDASTAIELFDIPADGRIKGHTRADVMLPVSVDDQEYIVKLLKKHKSLDFKRIAMDTKTNRQQLSEAKVKKLATKFYKLKDEERVVECSDRILELLEGLEEMSDYEE